MHKKYWILLLCIFRMFYGLAQSNGGARIGGVGNIGTVLSDLGTVFTNPANLPENKGLAVGINYTFHQLGKQYRDQSIAFAYLSGKSNLGLYIQQIGFSSYQDLKFGTLISKKFGPRFEIGVRANFHSLRITDYGQTSASSFDVGGLWSVGNSIDIGLLIKNISNSQYNTKTLRKSIIREAQFGIGYRSSDKIWLASEISFNEHQIGDIRSGMEY